jgi:conjugal transfer pilus assembly protein TraU
MESGTASKKASFGQSTRIWIQPCRCLAQCSTIQCLDDRGRDVPELFADSTHNDDKFAVVRTSYAFPFASLPTIGVDLTDATAATFGFPIKEIFWAAGTYG